MENYDIICHRWITSHFIHARYKKTSFLKAKIDELQRILQNCILKALLHAARIFKQFVSQCQSVDEKLIKLAFVILEQGQYIARLFRVFGGLMAPTPHCSACYIL